MFCLPLALSSTNRRLISPAMNITDESSIICSLTMQMRVAVLLSCLLVVIAGQGQYQCDVMAPCGCSAAQPTTAISRVIGGEDAQTDSWPWIVSIRLFDQHFCGGSILNSQFILTAAHCLAVIGDLSQVSILAGSLTSTPSSSSAQIRAIDRVISNPSYKANTNGNDLGLIRLKTPLDMTSKSVKPICLPSAGSPLPVDNATMVAIGWGVTSLKKSELPSILQQVTVRSINSQSFGCPNIIHYPRQQFCAGLPQGGKDTCQGDSGGPLMSFRTDRWYVDGLTSYGDRCALPQKPGVYTRVNYFVSWIQSTMNKNSKKKFKKHH